MIARKCIVISILICLTQVYDTTAAVQQILASVMKDMDLICYSHVAFRNGQLGKPLTPSSCTTDPKVFKHPDLCVANIDAVDKLCTLFRSSGEDISSYAMKISAIIAYIETSRGGSWSFDDFCAAFESIVSNPLYVIANTDKNQSLVEEERIRKINDEVRYNCVHMCFDETDDPKKNINIGCEMLLVWKWLLLEYVEAESFNKRKQIRNELYESTTSVTDESEELMISSYTALKSSSEYSIDNSTMHQVLFNNVRNDTEYEDGDEKIPSMKSTDTDDFHHGVSQETPKRDIFSWYILENTNAMRTIWEAVRLQGDMFSYTTDEMSKLVENERNQTNMLRSLMTILSNSKVTKTISIENDLVEE